MKSDQLEKAVAVLTTAKHTWSEGLVHSTDSLVQEALKQLLEYQDLRLLETLSFRTDMPSTLPKVLGN